MNLSRNCCWSPVSAYMRSRLVLRSAPSRKVYQSILSTFNTRNFSNSKHQNRQKSNNDVERTNSRTAALRNPRTALKSLQLSHSLDSGLAARHTKSTKTEICTTASTCERYDMNKVLEIIEGHGITLDGFIVTSEMIYFKYSLDKNKGKSPDILVLSNGSIVSWGMTEQQVLKKLVPLFKSAEIGPYKVVETEDMDFIDEVVDNSSSAATSTNRSTMVGDLIIIKASNDSDRITHKAAFSSGLARSTKLAALELVLERYISTIKEHSDRLASGADLKLSDKDVLRATGKLLQIRGQLNLYSELIETPDLYWSEPELENLYIMVSRQLDISPRIAILNKKLDYASEFVGILKSHTSERASTRLEWMIIILIMVEVVFETFHTYDRFMDKKKDNAEESIH